MLPERLRLIYQVGDGLPEVDFILIQGVGTPYVEEWVICSESWKDFLSKTAPPIRVLAFDYNVNLNDSFTLQSLLENGEILLENLSQLQGETGLIFPQRTKLGDRSSEDSQKSRSSQAARPMALMCHSLGGFVLKQALCIANAQSEKYGTLLSSILGIVFLGVPHISPSPSGLTDATLSIIRSIHNNLSKQSWLRLEEESRLLLDISRLFQDIELRVEILSLFEKVGTKVRTGWKKSRNPFSVVHPTILVNQELATTHAPREQCLGIETNHAELCFLGKPGGLMDQRLTRWMRSILSTESLDVISRRLHAFRIGGSSVAASTIITSYNMTQKAFTEESSNTAQDLIRSDQPTAGSSAMQDWEILPILSRFSPPRRTAKLPCFMMETPIRNRDFFGRESILKQLDEILLPSKDVTYSAEQNEQKHAVLCGMGGLGKTSIAIEFAFSRKEHFDAVFWVRADEISKLDQDFGQIARRLGLEDESEPQNPVVSRELARGWLANPKKVLNQDTDIIGQAEANWLLILDNADRPDILQDYWPLSENGSILVTSRDPLAKTSPSIAGLGIDVPPLGEEEGSTLLQHLARVDRDKDASAIIALKLGGLPLAISQMAAIIRYQYLSFPEFLERYDDEADRKDLLAYEEGAPRRETRGNLASIWAIENLGPQARTILELCSVLDPDGIPERILWNPALNLSLDGYPDRTSVYTTARAELLKSCLLNRSERGNHFWIHRVLQDSTRAKMSAERTRDIFEAAVTLTYSAWGATPPLLRYNTELAKKREELFAHAMSLINVFRAIKDDDDVPPISEVPIGRLICEAAWWQLERGYFTDAKEIFELAQAIGEAHPIEETRDLLCDTHFGLSSVANNTSDGQGCLSHNLVLLELRLQGLGSGEKPGVLVASAHNELGMGWGMIGQTDKAIAAFNRSIAVFRALDNYNPAMDTNPRTNLGALTWSMGNLEAASSYFGSLLRDREAVFGFNDTESFRTGRVLHGLGDVRFDQGRIEEAEVYHRRALTHFQLTLGNNHPKTAELCHHMAQHCMRRGELETAITFIDQGMSIWNLRKSTATRELARTNFLKSKIVRLTGNKVQADELLDVAVRLRSSIPGVPEKDRDQLRESDFDILVTYWSR